MQELCGNKPSFTLPASADVRRRLQALLAWMALAAFVALAATGLPRRALAEEVLGSPLAAQGVGDIHSGNWGGCPWGIDGGYRLTLYGGRAPEESTEPVPWYRWRDDIVSIDVYAPVVAPSSCQGLFANMRKLRSANLSRFRVSHVEDMTSMFSGCTKLESLNLSEWDTSMVQHMTSMFSGCSSLTSLNLSSLKTELVEDMASMFSGCTKLKSLDLTGWNTMRVAGEGCADMFQGCAALSSITVGSNYYINDSDMFPEPTSLSAPGKWWSTEEGAWYTKDQIVDGRSETPDTYTASATVPHFRSHSLTLDGMIGVNFLCDLSMLSQEELDSTYVAFTIGGKDARQTFVEYESSGTREGSACRAFTFPVKSIRWPRTSQPPSGAATRK